jgi:hypothetical protein
MKDRRYMDTGTFDKWGRQASAPLAVSVGYDGGKLLTYVREEGAFQLTDENAGAGTSTGAAPGAKTPEEPRQMAFCGFGHAFLPLS